MCVCGWEARVEFDIHSSYVTWGWTNPNFVNFFCSVAFMAVVISGFERYCKIVKSRTRRICICLGSYD